MNEFLFLAFLLPSKFTISHKLWLKCYIHICVIVNFFLSFPHLLIAIYTFSPFFQCICSLLHINKIFEVGISEHLAIKLQHMNIDLIGKVSVPRENNQFHQSNIEIWTSFMWLLYPFPHRASFMFSGKFFHYSRVGLRVRPGQFKTLSGFILIWKYCDLLFVCLIEKYAQKYKWFDCKTS